MADNHQVPDTYYQQLANKKRDFPVLIIRSKDSQVVYVHTGTGTNYTKTFAALNTYHEAPLNTSLFASFSDADQQSVQNWLDILFDEDLISFDKVSRSFKLK